MAQNEGTELAEKSRGEAIDNPVIPYFEKLAEQAPDHPRITYLIGAMEHKAGRFAKAIPHLTKAIALEPTDPHSLFLLAQCQYELWRDNANPSEEEGKELLAKFKKVLTLDPGFLTAVYYVGQVATRVAPDQFEEFSTMRQVQDNLALPFTFDQSYRWFGKLARLNAIAAPVNDPVINKLFDEPAAAIGKANYPSTKDAHFAVADLNGDRVGDLVLHHPAGPTSVLLQGADGTFAAKPEHDLAKLSGVRAMLFGDIDDNDLLDVIVCQKDAVAVWSQQKDGKWTDTTAARKWGVTGGASGGLLYDADHDGDLDLVLLQEKETTFLQNKGTGEFVRFAKLPSLPSSKQVVAFDVDTDRDLDLILLTGDSQPHVLINDRSLEFRLGKLMIQGLVDSSTVALASADLDVDGNPELLALNSKALKIASRKVGSNEFTVTECSLPNDVHAGKQIMVLDLTGTGVPSCLIQNENACHAVAIDVGKQQIALQQSVAGSCSTPVLVEPKRGPSLATLSPTGAMELYRPNKDRLNFISVLPVGHEDKRRVTHRSNHSGIGTTITARSAGRTSRQSNLCYSSAASQSLQPISLGIGNEQQADYLQFDWSNADFQIEVHQPADKLVVMKEFDRTISSCPILFTWNGKSYEFVTDLLGVGGIYYLTEPGKHYVPTDPTEHLLLPESALKPRECAGHRQAGQEQEFALRLVEPTEEITYLDAVKLKRYRVPKGWTMVLDERHTALPPAVSHQPIFFRTAINPKSATSETNADVLPALLKHDFVAVPQPPEDRLHPARHHVPQVLTLTFAQPIDVPNMYMLAEGWVDYPNSQTVYAAGQAGAEFIAPSLEARAGDQDTWQMVYPTFGYLAGMQRSMALPLNNLPKGTTQLRIKTTLRIAWDRIRLAVCERNVPVEVTELPIRDAVVYQAGFHQLLRGDEGRPHFKHDLLDPGMSSRWPIGEYTNYGSAKPLVTKADSAMAILGPGDGIELTFLAPPTITKVGVADDMQTYTVLEVKGYCKGMNLYSAHSETVAPIPEADKRSGEAKALERKYNRRLRFGVSATRLRMSP